MHNIIIEKECGKDLDMTKWVNRFGRVGGKTASNDFYHDIRDFSTKIFKEISSRSGGHGMSNKITSSTSMFHVMCDEPCVTFDEQFAVQFDVMD